MKTPQVVNPYLDKYLAFDGDSVIDDDDQLPLGKAPHNKTTITIDFNAYNITTGSLVASSGLPMDYQSDTEHWLLDLTFIPDFLNHDRHKFVAKISENSGGIANMRTFKIGEFSIDLDGFEQALMRLPYQVEISGGEAWMRWYDGAAPGVGNVKWEAPLYKDGIGTTWATELSNVSHRGAIVEA